MLAIASENMSKLLLWNKNETQGNKTEDKAHFKGQGLCRLDTIDDIPRLYNESQVNAAGIPDMFAHPFDFTRQLDKGNHQQG